MKLHINKGKLIRNEELITLRGGYGETNCEVICSSNQTCIDIGGPCNDCMFHPVLKEKRCRM
jgi:hypothetical protein